MAEPVIIGDAVLYRGDCLEILPTLEAGSADAVVTDSPYGLGFMGKDWDHGVPGVHFWTEILRVAKPGAYLLAFGGTRTYHRLGCAIEDAGWEIRDCVGWLYGSGFPKSLNVALEFEQELCEYRLGSDGKKRWYYLGEDAEMMRVPPFRHPLANQWAGWGTALKPAWEPIIVARKPLDGTVAANVLAHGMGGLNIDGCRVEIDPTADASQLRTMNRSKRGEDTSGQAWGLSKQAGDRPQVVRPQGRWPANVVHDGSGEVVGLFPQGGASGKASGPTRGKLGTQGRYGTATGENMGESCFYGDSGSAARFFYCAKASKKDRDEGLEAVAPSALPLTRGTRCAVCGKWDRPNCQCECENPQWEEAKPRRNAHPTVKPTALMRWLVRLVAPPGGIVLDPFMGSGSTGKACAKEGFRFIGIELDADYFDIACRRIEDAMTGGPLLAESERHE